jgi:hypothetical protein
MPAAAAAKPRGQEEAMGRFTYPRIGLLGDDAGVVDCRTRAHAAIGDIIYASIQSYKGYSSATFISRSDVDELMGADPQDSIFSKLFCNAARAGAAKLKEFVRNRIESFGYDDTFVLDNESTEKIQALVAQLDACITLAQQALPTTPESITTGTPTASAATPSLLSLGLLIGVGVWIGHLIAKR